MSLTSQQMARRQRAGRFNRWLGYVVLPLLVVSTSIHFANRTDDPVQDITHAMLLPLFFVHVALSFYVYGLVRPRRTLRVFHIYFGYLTFVFVMLSQSRRALELVLLTDDAHVVDVARTVFTVLMYLAIAVHIAIGVRYGVTRRATEVPRRTFSRVP